MVEVREGLISLAWVLALYTEIVALMLAGIVLRYSYEQYGRVPYTDKRDAFGIVAYGTIIAVLLAASHYVPWPQW